MNRSRLRSIAVHGRASRPLPGVQPAGLPGLPRAVSPKGEKGVSQGSNPKVGFSPRGTPTYTQPAPGVNVLEDIFASVSPKTPEEAAVEGLKKRVGKVK